jgi:hypothetical protein
VLLPTHPLRIGPLLVVALLACSTVRVSSDYDPETDFGAYRRYAWLPRTPEATGHPRLDSPMVQDRVRRGIDRSLAEKGYGLGGEQADFFVTYHLAVDRKLDIRSTERSLYGRYGYRISIPETTVQEYDEGSLIVDVVDAKHKRVVWRGVGSRRLRGASGVEDPVRLQERVYEVVDEVLADFPPGRK